MASGDPLLEFDSVHAASADGREILHGISFGVAAGELVVLAGPSGAGKSTLLRLGDRLDIPSAGVVRFDGHDIAGLDARLVRRSVGMVFQVPSLFSGTVRDNLSVADPSASDEVFAGVLLRVGLPAELLDRVGDDLSGGEAQRVCIARALLTRPSVLLMDEPTSSLDPDNRAGIETTVRRLVADGMAVVWVTHDLTQARRIGDRIIVLTDGAVADEGATKRYLDPRERS